MDMKTENVYFQKDFSYGNELWMESNTRKMTLLEDSTKLLFYESFQYNKCQYNIEEIFFSKPVYLHQIRILKANSSPHNKVKLGNR